MEVMDYNKIKTTALALGACDKVTTTQSLPALLQLLFTPQGMEFAKEHHFPDAALFREFKPQLPNEYKIDADIIELENPARVALIGNTHAKIKYTTCDYRCELLVFEGATAEIEVSGYGLCFWADCGASSIKITTKGRGQAYEL